MRLLFSCVASNKSRAFNADSGRLMGKPVIGTYQHHCHYLSHSVLLKLVFRLFLLLYMAHTEIIELL